MPGLQESRHDKHVVFNVLSDQGQLGFYSPYSYITHHLNHSICTSDDHIWDKIILF